jgi:hypothetical protein
LPETPQNSVVVASEIWPSLSAHSRALQLREVAHQADRAVRDRLQRRLGARDLQVEQRRDDVQQDDRRDRRLGRRVDAGVEHRHVEPSRWRDARPDELAAEQHAEDDRADRQPFDPAVGLDELRVRQQLGQDCRTWAGE